MQVDAGSVDALRSMAWPNPTSGATTIQFRLDQPGTLLVTLHDIQGKEVARFDRGASSPGQQAIGFDAGGLSDGLYYYRITSDGRHRGGGSLLVTH
jgi:serine protease AprX